MAEVLKGKKVAILVANEGVEQVEMTEPVKALRKAGAEVDLIAPEGGQIQAFNHLDKGDVFEAGRSIEEAGVDDYDALVLPGGVANPDQPRTAGVLGGRTITSWPSLRTDIENAGAAWVDEEVRVDRGLVTSRKPDDLPAFNAKIIEEFAEGAHEGQKLSAGHS